MKCVRALTWLALLLAGVAGGVDAIGWLTLDGICVAHMSGNTVGVTTHVTLGEGRRSCGALLRSSLSSWGSPSALPVCPRG